MIPEQQIAIQVIESSDWTIPVVVSLIAATATLAAAWLAAKRGR